MNYLARRLKEKGGGKGADSSLRIPGEEDETENVTKKGNLTTVLILAYRRENRINR